MTLDAESRALIREDARELQRGVLTAYAGYALKLALPVLLALATRAYGAERWGRFATAQALVLLATRGCLLGLDKAVLWYVPQHSPSAARGPVLAAARRTGLIACAASLAAVAVSAAFPALAHDRGVLGVSALALAPLVLSDVLLNATMGLRRMELQVLVRDTLAPAVQILVALLMAELGYHELGLAVAFVVSQWLGAGVAWIGFRRLFGVESGPGERTLPPELSSYAGPFWLAELGNSLLLRLDTLLLSALTDPATVGVWAVVSQFGNALRQIRRTYDPMVTALAARIARSHDGHRLGEALSYAMQMVTVTQLPVFAGFSVLAEVVLPLYGAGFERGAVALVVLAGFFLFGGGAGLAGLVVAGYGQSRLVFLNVLLALAVELAGLVLLVPRYGLVGAACAVGASLCVTNVAQLIELRVVTGSLHVTQRTRFTLRLAWGTMAALGASFLLSAGLSPWPRRLLALAVFCAAYGLFLWSGHRRGLLAAPGRGEGH